MQEIPPDGYGSDEDEEMDNPEERIPTRISDKLIVSENEMYDDTDNQ